MSAKKYFTVGVIIFALGGAVFFIMGKSYPVATVNGAFISAREFNVYYGAAKTYFAKVQQATSTGAGPSFEENLKQVSLETLINYELVRAGLVSMLGEELPAYIDKKVQYLRDDSNLNDAARELYGLNAEDFENFILVPAAREEILGDRFYFDQVTIDEWIEDQRRSADVVVLLPGFSWKDGEVVAK